MLNNSKMKSKNEFFGDRVTYYKSRIQTVKSKAAMVSWLRIAVFLVFVALVILFLNLQHGSAIAGSSALFIAGFVLLVKWHNRLKNDLEFCETIAAVNQQEVDRLEHNFANIRGMSEYNDDNHPYSADLDLFGRNSIFQLINRAETRYGIDRITSWLAYPSTKDVIESRQHAIRELIPLVDWRQEVQARGKGKETDKETEKIFFDWLQGKNQIGNHISGRIAPLIASVLSLFTILAIFMDLMPFFSILIPIVFCTVFILKAQAYSKSTYQMTISGMRLLKSIRNILKLIETQAFSNPDLLTLQNGLFDKDHNGASDKIKQLEGILDLFNNRGNQFYHIINSFFLLDYLLLIRAEKWRNAHRNEVASWLDIMAEIEALGSIAAFAYANESYVFPEISASDCEYVAEEMGHPLIPDGVRVHNDFAIGSRGSISIITGSNMAGKSTFLRTVGVNAVLAFCGAPVCARSLKVTVFQLFTSMRTKDNLEEHISSFYAELLRIKKLLEVVNEDRPVMFLLDEILKGTNSADRHAGAEALTLQLSGLNTFGLISTHDLELGKLSADHKNISNFNFSSDIHGEEIVFDYKLRDGICKSTNASQLMAKMGIRINPES